MSLKCSSCGSKVKQGYPEILKLQLWCSFDDEYSLGCKNTHGYHLFIREKRKKQKNKKS